MPPCPPEGYQNTQADSPQIPKEMIGDPPDHQDQAGNRQHSAPRRSSTIRNSGRIQQTSRLSRSSFMLRKSKFAIFISSIAENWHTAQSGSSAICPQSQRRRPCAAAAARRRKAPPGSAPSASSADAVDCPIISKQIAQHDGQQRRLQSPTGLLPVRSNPPYHGGSAALASAGCLSVLRHKTASIASNAHRSRIQKRHQLHFQHQFRPAVQLNTVDLHRASLLLCRIHAQFGHPTALLAPCDGQRHMESAPH